MTSSKIKCTSELKINAIYFVVLSVVAIFASENETNQNQITRYGWRLDMCKGELRPDRLDGWLYRSRHRCHFLGARVKEQERREGKRIKEYK